MKKMMYAGAMLCAMALMTGCSQEEYDDNGQLAPSGNFTLTASTGSNSRTSVADNFNVNWTAGDAIFVYGGANTSGKLTLDGDGGQTTGTFKGTVTGTPADLQYAVYPADGFAKSKAKPTTFTFPATYEYPATGSMASNSPMFGKVGNSDGVRNVTFTQHLAGMIRITLNDVPANSTNNSLTLKGTGVAGTYQLTVTDDNASLASSTTSSGTSGQSDSSDQVAINFNSKSGNLVFDIPVPAGTYSGGLSVVLKMGEATATVYSIENNTVTAGKIILMPAINNITLDGNTIGFTQATADEKGAQEALDKGVTNIAIESVDASSQSATLKIPATTNDAPTTITLASLNTGDNNTLTIEAKDNNKVEQPVNINLDNSSSSNNKASLVIELPNSHVTLAPVGETTTIDKVVSNSSATTLVVEAGVTVKELIIKGGNVEVRGIVEKLSRDVSNSATVAVASFGAADIKEVVNPENFTFTSTWDGVSKVAATNNLIYTAAQLANLQVTTIPNSVNASSLPFSISASTTLKANIDLDNKPWLGMVLGNNCIFDGGSHTISNVLMEQFVLDEQSIYTPSAAVGLFAATKPNSEIKSITVDGFKAQASATEAKWVGALVGYSRGTKAYTDCHAKNVNIISESADAYRIGGLIGFIGSASTDELNVELTNCSVEDVAIKASFCIGGLVGSLQGTGRTFSGCSVKNATLSVNDASITVIRDGAFSGSTFYAPKGWWAGYMSKFIGEANCDSITIKDNCNVDAAFTSTEIEGFYYGDIAEYSYSASASSEDIAQIKASAKHYRLENGNIFLPACVDKGTITVDGNQLVSGTDYNKFTEITASAR